MHIKTGWLKPQAITCDLNMMENSREWWCLHSGIPKNGPQTWQWRAGVMESTKSLIKILIETIRQWQMHCDLDLSWRDQSKCLTHDKLPTPCQSWPRCHVSLSLFIISGDAGLLHLLCSSSQPDSPQPLTSNLPSGLIFPWVACVNQAQGLIDRSYRWWISLLLPIWAFSSDWETIGAPTISCACSQCLPGGRDATSVALLSLPFLNNPQSKSL